MTFQILLIDRVGGFLQPLLYQRGTDIVIVAPPLVPCVVGWIDENTLEMLVRNG